MARFKVWEDGSDEPTHAVDAFDHEEAATGYADNDCDGQADGIYRNGRVLCVRRDDEQRVRRFIVTVEYEPRFYASEVDETGRLIPLALPVVDDIPV